MWCVLRANVRSQLLTRPGHQIISYSRTLTGSCSDSRDSIALFSAILIPRLLFIPLGGGRDPLSLPAFEMGATAEGILAVLSSIILAIACVQLVHFLGARSGESPLRMLLAFSFLPISWFGTFDIPFSVIGFGFLGAALSAFTLNREKVGWILYCVASSISPSLIIVPPVLSLILKSNPPYNRGSSRVQLYFATTIVAIVVYGIGSAVLNGESLEVVTINQLFRGLMSRGFGALGLLALLVGVGGCAWIAIRQRSTRSPFLLLCTILLLNVVFVLLQALSYAGMFVMALVILVACSRMLSRSLQITILIMCMLSPFLFSASRLRLDTEVFSPISGTIHIRGKSLYLDLVQGPLLFDVARARTVRNETATSVVDRGSTGTGNRGDSMWLTAYYPVWSLGISNGGMPNPMPPQEMNWNGITHLVHFGIGPQQTEPYWSPAVRNRQGIDDSLNLVWAAGWLNGPGRLNMIDSLRKYATLNGTKLLLSCGGIWGEQARNMDFITIDSVRTQKFVDAVCGFAWRHGYDGVEIDYEPPQSREQMSRLTRIMRRALGHWTPRGILITAVANGTEESYDTALIDSIDQYNFMMYDMHFVNSGISSNGSPEDVVGFNAPLFPADNTLYPELSYWGYNYNGRRGGIGAATSPRKFIRMGFPPEKVGAGLPFYGYIYPGRLRPNQRRNGAWPQYVSQVDCRTALRVGGERYWEPQARVPWIAGVATTKIGWMVKPGDEFYITYDDSASLVEKIRWAKSLNLGGIMVYELWTGWLSDEPQGKQDQLFRSVVEELKR
jgi:chitinase